MANSSFAFYNFLEFFSNILDLWLIGSVDEELWMWRTICTDENTEAKRT